MDPIIRDPLALRLFRLLLGLELIVAPFLFGWPHTFAQEQSVTVGILVVMLGACGLLVAGVRPLLFLAGAWLVCSPAWSGFYFAAPNAVLHDVVIGAVLAAVSFVPIPIGDLKLRRRQRLPLP